LPANDLLVTEIAGCKVREVPPRRLAVAMFNGAPEEAKKARAQRRFRDKNYTVH
jgi:hypothetical protein